MNSNELRQKFLDFFKEKEHKIVESSSLLTDDPSVLLTTAGMQQFKPYFLGQKSPYGDRVATSQKCFRTSDIDEVGDATHLTFFEMLGNFSFGGYFKEEAIEYAVDFLTKEIGLDRERIWFTVFKGIKKPQEIPRDTESEKIIKNLGFSGDRISEFGVEDNFWGPTGETGPCGPTCEIHYETDKKRCSRGEKCGPNCECGKFIEIWNLVFNQYYKKENGELKPLEQQGIDTGMGFERLAAVCQEKLSVFETDLFAPILKESAGYNLPQGVRRVIADHIKASAFLIADGVLPSNVKQGYILRRLLRKVIRYQKLLDLPPEVLFNSAEKAIQIYKKTYPELKSKQEKIINVIKKEKKKYEKALEKGEKEFLKKSEKGYITGKEAFHLYHTYSVPIDMIEELADKHDVDIKNKDRFRKEFEEAFEKHQEVSRAGAEKKSGGVGIDNLESKKEKQKATKLHTATHLLHQALRKVLGDHVKQMGSDINPDRLRFDFSHPKKMTDKEIKKVERLVNKIIKKDLKVEKKEMPLKKALDSGALAFFKAKYPDRVSVYSITKPETDEAWSKEVCAGPHVKRTSELGSFKIKKEKSSSAGVRRIKAVLK